MGCSTNCFSHENLQGLAAEFGSDDFGPAIRDGFDGPDFARLLVLIGGEIRLLYDLSEEANLVVPSSSSDALTSFLYDLSAFLAQIDCPYDSLCCGKIEQRFVTEEARGLLVRFLLDELKCARLSAADRLQMPSTSADSRLAVSVAAAAAALGMQPIGAQQTAEEYLKRMTDQVSRLCSSSPRPAPLFTAALEPHRWPAVETVAKRIGHDFRLRNLYLLKRLEVTMESFLFNPEIRRKEAAIIAQSAPQKDKLARFEPPGVVELLAASERSLIIRKASSVRVPRSSLHPSALEERPADRGGRPNETDLPNPRSFDQNYGRGRGGGFGGGGHGGRRGGDRGGRGGGYGSGGRGGGDGQRMSAEQQTRREYENRSTGGTRGEDSGRGGGRGGGRGYGSDHRGGRGGGYGSGGRGGGGWRGRGGAY
ncbi:tag-322 [Pristionchus pacificus]|nr:tag-322 [Pristionchus pacificus]